MRRSMIFLLTVFLCGVPQVFGQLRSHEVGRLWDTMFPSYSYNEYSPLQDQMTYPGGDFSFQTPKNLERRAIWIGVKNWTDRLNVFHPFYVSEGGPLNFEAPDILEPISNKKKVRQRLPIVNVNSVKESRLLDSRSGRGISRSTSLPSDERITTEWATDAGITVTMNSYAYANRNHDSYIILEYTFLNNGNIDASKTTAELPGQNLEGVYFGFQMLFLPSGDVGHQQTDEFDDWCHFYGNQPGDTLRGIWYAYDGDSQRVPSDDIGDPDDITGEFLSPQYVGFGILHADASATDESNDLSQPHTVSFAAERAWKSHLRGDTDQSMYVELSSGQQSQGTDVMSVPGPWDPQVQHPMLLLSFGPYDIPFGEDVRIVLYEAAGSISRRQAISAGREWKEGTLSFNGLTGDAAKNALIATGRDSLLMYASRAEWVWEHGLDSVPDGPPAPGLNLNVGPGKVILDWESVEDELDPDTKQPDFSGYRVYRAVNSFTNVYELIWECGGNSGVPVTNMYVDRDVERGTNYFYYVTAYDDGSQNIGGLHPGQSVESSHFYNRNYQYGAVPILGARKQLDSVYVVPNPYHAQGLVFGGTVEEDYTALDARRPEDKISFVGLPATAVIRIFTAHGDLVKTLHHPNPENAGSVPESQDETWWQISDSWQLIKSGVYFYYVEGWDLEGKPLGTTTGKFVIIR